MLDQAPLPPKAAIEHLVESLYGFSLVDLGITPQDIADFDQIAIERKLDYNRCEDLAQVETELAPFLKEVGNNDPEIVRRVAMRIGQIATQILEASGKETAWVWVRAATPADGKNRLFWHFDWPYYLSRRDPTMEYRFVMTLAGPPTLFYPLLEEETAFRKKIWKEICGNRFKGDFCDPDQVFIPPRNVGVVLLNRERGALHSEPSRFEGGRLFLSIIPCSKQEMTKLEPRVREHFGMNPALKGRD